VIQQVYSRIPQHAEILAKELGASGISSVTRIIRDADIYIFAIADDELYKLKEWMFTTSRIVVHTAGSVSRDVLKVLTPQYGVLYPLQTLKKDIGVINGIPFFVDGNSDGIRQQIFDLAKSVSENVQYADDETRRKLHLGAVVVNNFSNYLFALTEQYCKNEGLDFKSLSPLIAEGAMRINSYSPAVLQTGPAFRNDLSTISKQRELLQQYPELLRIYELFTEIIASGQRH
ncbi:MAG: DUF2520 domain-containing protein, partial [Chitinophagaceae bacterium]|nr:DUF2520 domain-containing protein [Chitinophagaceae bacterium]